MSLQVLDREREQMVKRQMAWRGIRERRVLKAMAQVPRELFVPLELREHAFEDRPLPIGQGQTISQPYMVALMCEALLLEPEARVLEIGTGSGYSAAVLGHLAAEVHTIERSATLAQQARERLEELGYDQVKVHQGDGSLGWPEGAPYQGIVVTAGAPHVPATLLEQMDIEGRMVIPTGPTSEQELWRIRRTSATEWKEEHLCAVRFVPLIGEEGWPVSEEVVSSTLSPTPAPLAPPDVSEKEASSPTVPSLAQAPPISAPEPKSEGSSPSSPSPEESPLAPESPPEGPKT